MSNVPPTIEQQTEGERLVARRNRLLPFVLPVSVLWFVAIVSGFILPRPYGLVVIVAVWLLFMFVYRAISGVRCPRCHTPYWRTWRAARMSWRRLHLKPEDFPFRCLECGLDLDLQASRLTSA